MSVALVTKADGGVGAAGEGGGGVTWVGERSESEPGGEREVVGEGGEGAERGDGDRTSAGEGGGGRSEREAGGYPDRVWGVLVGKGVAR